MSESFAERLRGVQALRAQKGIPLHRIAAETCISRRYLEAIEASQWDRLPDGVYRVSYVRQYMQAIDPGLSGSFVAAAFQEPAPTETPAASGWRAVVDALRLRLGL